MRITKKIIANAKKTNTQGEHAYVVALRCGGCMENPNISYENFQIIHADSEKEAERKYNEINKCSYYYGEVLKQLDKPTEIPKVRCNFKECRKGLHPFKIIACFGYGDETQVVRWCPECGAIVVDMDFDGRTNPGYYRELEYPNITKKYGLE